MVQRQTAYIVSAADLLNGEYIKVEGEWEPNYVKVGARNVSRVNLLGTVISVLKEAGFNYEQITVDDGTATINIRSFNQPGFMDGVGIGDVVLVIGKLRQYNNDIYIIPEIAKHVDDPKWILVRQLELKLLSAKEPGQAVPRKEEKPNETAPVLGEGVVSESTAAGGKKDDNGESPSQRVFNLIKMLDDGGGADYDMVISKSGISGCENIIMTLMEAGEIFELRPGKLKVLE